MANDLILGIVGATGLVGNEIVALLDEVKLPIAGVRLYGSSESMGEVYKAGGFEATVEELNDESFEGVSIVIFSAPMEVCAKYIPVAVKSGARVIDLSGTYREDTKIPLVVSEVNPETALDTAKIIALPRPVSVGLSVILDQIRKLSRLSRVVISTYHGCSEAGKAALDELWEQTLAVFNQSAMPNEAFQHQIAFNCVPQVDLMLESGITREEEGIVREVRRVLSMPELRMSVTAVRVPVLHGHGLSVNVETPKAITPEQLIEKLESTPGITVHVHHDEYPMHLDAVGSSEIHVGRIRKDDSVPHGLSLWIVNDNLRKGSALNALQVADILLKRFHA